MTLLYLHLTGGKTLAFLLPESDARQVVDTVRMRWHHPDPEALDIGIGEGDEVDTWLRVADISGLELKPAEPTKEAP